MTQPDHDPTEPIFAALVAALLACVVVCGVHLALAAYCPIGGAP